MTQFTPIDLSKVPAPEMIKEVSYDQVLADMKAYLISIYPDAEAALSDETGMNIKTLQACAYYITLVRSDANQQSLANMLAFAAGGDLDHRAVPWNLLRKDTETDDAFRARIQIAPEGLSVAGPAAAYIKHTKDVILEGDKITDVYFTVPVSPTVEIYLLTESGEVLPEHIQAVIDYLKPLTPQTEQVVVLPFVDLTYVITATLTMAGGPSSALVLGSAQAALETYLATRRKFGEAIYLSKIVSALAVSGVENVVLTSPVADIIPAANQVARPSAITIEETS